MHLSHKVFLSTWSLVLCVSTAPQAFAQAGDSQSQAQAQAAGRALFEEGSRLFEQGKYAEACKTFEASLVRFSGTGTRGRLAECYEKIGRTASAWALYREVASLSARAGETDRKEVAEERAKALEPKLARITVAVPRGVPVPGLVVKRNGEAFVAGELGAAIAVDPGEVLIEASAPGYSPWSQRVPVEAARTVRIDVPELKPTPGQKYPPPVETSHYGWQRPAGLVVGGVGIATMLVGGYFGLSAKSTYDDAVDSNCNAGAKTCNDAGLSDTDSAKDKALLSTILVGAGAAMTVTGVVLFLTAPKRTSTTGVRVAPDAGVGRAGVVLSGRF